MDYSNIAQVAQVTGTDIRNSTRKVNACLADGWKILSILQLSDVNHDGGYSCALFVLGHADINAKLSTVKDEF